MIENTCVQYLIYLLNLYMQIYYIYILYYIIIILYIILHYETMNTINNFFIADRLMM